MAATVSLICWGGRAGKTVTLSIGSPCVGTIASSGLRAGTRLVFSTTGALPAGITAGVTYYVKPTAQNTFNLCTDAALTSIVNTSGSQSGTHTAKSVTMLEYFAQYPGRWGSSGSERCYDGIESMLTARNAAYSRIIPELIEFGEAFTEYATYGRTLRVGNAPQTSYESRVADARTLAYHGGVIGAGYVNLVSNYGHIAGSVTTIDGLQFEHLSAAATGIVMSTLGTHLKSTVRNCIFLGKSITSGSKGLQIQGGLVDAQRNLAVGFTEGITHYDSGGGGIIGSNTVVKCGYGFRSSGDSLTYRYSTWCNNISVGNTTNWGTQPNTLEFASGNFGETGNTPWITAGGATGAMTTANFVDFANNDFRLTSSSPAVDAGIEYYGITTTDIADAECPNYNNGSAEGFDVGCYEYDHGYGNHPATATIALTSLVAGSRVLITRDDTGAALYNDTPGVSLSLTTSYLGNFTVIVRKASASPYYREFAAGGTTVADQTTSIKVLQQLDE